MLFHYSKKLVDDSSSSSVCSIRSSALYFQSSLFSAYSLSLQNLEPSPFSYPCYRWLFPHDSTRRSTGSLYLVSSPPLTHPSAAEPSEYLWSWQGSKLHEKTESRECSPLRCWWTADHLLGLSTLQSHSCGLFVRSSLIRATVETSTCVFLLLLFLIRPRRLSHVKEAVGLKEYHPHHAYRSGQLHSDFQQPEDFLHQKHCFWQQTFHGHMQVDIYRL